MVTGNQPDLKAYEAALQRAAFFPLVDPGALLISGADHKAFLQRQTTNELSLLSLQRALVTVLTSPVARILDVLTLLEEDEAILALTLPGRSAETARFLRSRIFFMDKVSVEDCSLDFRQIDLLGPGVGEAAGMLGLLPLPGIDAASEGEIAGTSVRNIGLRGSITRLLVPRKDAKRVEAVLVEAGIARLDLQTYHLLRVEGGLPAAGHELSEEYTPLEAGLEYAISASKGCYTGQEVIARQITYDKVTRRLVGLELEGNVNAGDLLRSSEGGPVVGTVTSAAHSPRFGQIALAIVKRPFNQPDSELICGEVQSGILAHVRALPFT